MGLLGQQPASWGSCLDHAGRPEACNKPRVIHANLASSKWGLGLAFGYLGMKEKKMETTMMGIYIYV